MSKFPLKWEQNEKGENRDIQLYRVDGTSLLIKYKFTNETQGNISLKNKKREMEIRNK